jgi:Coenzyme PQQ synthesis protein D (PqqD)
MDDETIVTRNEEMMSAPVDRELVFLNQATDSYVALDEVGRKIWDLLERPRRLGDLIEQLCRQFDGLRAEIRSDVVDFLNELDREGMVRVSDRGAG